MSSGLVELPLDDVTYVMAYNYSESCPATRYEPADGGVEIVTVDVILRGGVRLPVANYDQLQDLPELIERAYAQQREHKECA